MCRGERFKIFRMGVNVLSSEWFCIIPIRYKFLNSRLRKWHCFVNGSMLIETDNFGLGFASFAAISGYLIPDNICLPFSWTSDFTFSWTIQIYSFGKCCECNASSGRNHLSVIQYEPNLPSWQLHIKLANRNKQQIIGNGKKILSR